MIDYEYIDRYINKELSDEESARFEQQLQTDAEFAEAYQLYLSIQDTMQADTVSDETMFRQQLQPLQQKYFAKDENKTNGKIRRLIYWSVAAAAIAVLVFTLIPFGKPGNKSTDSLYAEYAVYDKLDETVRGEEQDSIFGRAAKLFNDKKYAQAIPLLEQIKKDKPQAQFWLGVSYIETKNFTTAIANFDALINGNSLYQPNAQWYKALVYLKQNNKAACKQQLQLIPPTSPFYKKAALLQKDL